MSNRDPSVASYDRWFAPATDAMPARVGVIAELGVNHDGRRQVALDLVTAAARAGADAVKLQLFEPEHLLSNQARLARYQQDAAAERDVRGMLQRLALSDADMRAVRDRAGELGLRFLVTLFSLEDAPRLERLAVDAVKIASPDAVNAPLLAVARSLGRPLLISTGTCACEELVDAAAAVQASDGALLQCVSAYPTPIEHAALGGIAALREAWGVAVGYSDHTAEVATGAWAVTAGACLLEKHLTHDRAAAGPDHAVSLEPDDLADYISQARYAAIALGPRVKRVLAIEAEVRELSRQSLCATRSLPTGHRLTREDVTVRRPGTGIPAAQLERVLGQRLRRAVQVNDLIAPDDLESATSAV